MSSDLTTYSIQETAKILKLRPSYVKYLIENGHIDFFLPPGRKQRRIKHSSISDFLNNNTFNSKLGLS